MEGAGEDAPAQPANPGGGVTLRIDGPGRYHFENPVDEGLRYRVRIDAHPVNPGQVCYFPDANRQPRGLSVEGRIAGGSVRDLHVLCTPSASLTLALPGQGRDVGVRAALVRDSDGALIGRTCPGARLPAGGGDLLVVPADADCRRPEDVVPTTLSPGNHTVHVLLDTNGQGGLQPGDGTLRAPVFVPDRDELVVLGPPFGAAQLRAADWGGGVPSVSEPVTVRGLDFPSRASVRCSWTAPRASRPALPVADELGASELTCDPHGPACFETVNGRLQARTNRHDPLAPGTYSLTCWVDVGGPRGSPNGVLDGPDRVGFVPRVTVDGAGLVGSQAVVEVEAP